MKSFFKKKDKIITFVLILIITAFGISVTPSFKVFVFLVRGVTMMDEIEKLTEIDSDFSVSEITGNLEWDNAVVNANTDILTNSLLGSWVDKHLTVLLFSYNGYITALLPMDYSDVHIRNDGYDNTYDFDRYVAFDNYIVSFTPQARFNLEYKNNRYYYFYPLSENNMEVRNIEISEDIKNFEQFIKENKQFEIPEILNIRENNVFEEWRTIYILKNSFEIEKFLKEKNIRLFDRLNYGRPTMGCIITEYKYKMTKGDKKFTIDYYDKEIFDIDTDVIIILPNDKLFTTFKNDGSYLISKEEN